jgi:segregation and condensation protein A
MSVDTELGTGKFQVHLEEFDGPFDLLLGLIARHKLEVTELALSQVTDEFLS